MDEIWHDDADWPLTGDRPSKFRIFKKQNGGVRHLENHKNYDISTTVSPIFAKFGTLVQNGPLDHPDRYKFEFHKSKMADGCHFENR